MWSAARWIVVERAALTPHANVKAAAPAALVSRFMLSSQKLADPNRTMFERIFLRGEKQTEVTTSMGLTHHDYQQMLRTLAASTQ